MYLYLKDIDMSNMIIEERNVKYGCWTLTGIKKLFEKYGRRTTYLECKCICGTLKFIRLNDLRNGNTKSCGCKKSEFVSAASTIHGCAGDKIHPIYTIWRAMKARCTNPNSDSYGRYGAIGINVFKEWENNFLSFYEWSINNGWKEGLTIDRYPNKKGNYDPSNCRWADYATQNRNTSRNINITAFGETKCIADWLLDYRCKISREGLKKRIKTGWDVEIAILTPPDKKYVRYKNN